MGVYGWCAIRQTLEHKLLGDKTFGLYHTGFSLPEFTLLGHIGRATGCSDFTQVSSEAS
jgi:hypothetical protein